MDKMIEALGGIRIRRVSKIQNDRPWNYKLYRAGKAPGDELTEEQRSLPMGKSDAEAPMNSAPFTKWMSDYVAVAKVSANLTERNTTRGHEANA